MAIIELGKAFFGLICLSASSGEQFYRKAELK